MRQFDAIEQAVIIIEENLTKELNKKSLAESVYMSEFHFYRVFKEITGYSIGQYIRARKLSCATMD